MLPWQLETLADAQAVAERCAAEFLRNSPSARTVGLSGGRIAKDFFRAVTLQARNSRASLAHLHFFWADERCVPPDHAESNYRSAAELMFTPLALPADNLHRIRGETKPEEAARDAEAELRRFAPANATGQPVLDLVLLGMGEDGHVASLFPQVAPAMRDDSAVYRPVLATKPPPQRITLGYQPLFAAKQIWVLASGQGKADALRESLTLTGQTPLAAVLRGRLETRIFSDLKP